MSPRFREIRAEELRAEAAAIVAERRGAAVMQGLNLQPSIPGVFAWLPAPPPAGERVTLAYNKAHGALRCGSLGCLCTIDVCLRHLAMRCTCVGPYPCQLQGATTI